MSDVWDSAGHTVSNKCQLFLVFKGELQIFRIFLKAGFRAVCTVPSHPLPSLSIFSLCRPSFHFFSSVEWIVCKWLLVALQVPDAQLCALPPAERLSPEVVLPWTSHGASLWGTHVPRAAAAHPPCCPERSPQGNAADQSSGSVLPKTFQTRGAHGGDREGSGILSPGHLTTAMPTPPVYAGCTSRGGGG